MPYVRGAYSYVGVHATGATYDDLARSVTATAVEQHPSSTSDEQPTKQTPPKKGRKDQATSSNDAIAPATTSRPSKLYFAGRIKQCLHT
jgi:hypothetical protein